MGGKGGGVMHGFKGGAQNSRDLSVIGKKNRHKEKEKETAVAYNKLKKKHNKEPRGGTRAPRVPHRNCHIQSRPQRAHSHYSVGLRPSSFGNSRLRGLVGAG